MEVNVFWFLKHFWKKLLSRNCRYLSALRSPDFVCNNVKHLFQFFQSVLRTEMHTVQNLWHVHHHHRYALRDCLNQEVVKFMELRREISWQQSLVQNLVQMLKVWIISLIELQNLVKKRSVIIPFHFV